MKLGTKSLLFGAHQFVLHPLFLAWAWFKLYGSLPRDPRVWVAFLVHDWGYWGCSNMDGREGVAHPLYGAILMSRWFDRRVHVIALGEWWRFTAGHSRSCAANLGIPTSPLMAADKLATVLMPRAVYVLLVWLSGEWLEYRARWIASGNYPGKADDNVWVWSGHLRENWRRFERRDAVAGTAYGGD